MGRSASLGRASHRGTARGSFRPSLCAVSRGARHRVGWQGAPRSGLACLHVTRGEARVAGGGVCFCPCTNLDRTNNDTKQRCSRSPSTEWAGKRQLNSADLNLQTRRLVFLLLRFYLPKTVGGETQSHAVSASQKERERGRKTVGLGSYAFTSLTAGTPPVGGPDSVRGSLWTPGDSGVLCCPMTPGSRVRSVPQNAKIR